MKTKSWTMKDKIEHKKRCVIQADERLNQIISDESK